MLPALRLRDFRLLWAGQAVSLLGDGVFYVALAWQVYQLSGAATALSVVGVAMSLAQVTFLLLGGVVSDRLPRRLVMLAADLLRALAMAALGLLAAGGGLELWHVVVLAALYGTGAGFFGPAFDAIVPDLVPAELLAGANSLDQIVRPAALRLAGPALGGWLVAAAGTGGAFLLDGASFLASAATLALLRAPGHTPPDAPGPAPPPASLLRDVREGLAFVRRHVWLWGTLLAAAAAYLLFMGPSEVLLPLLVKQRLGGGAGDLGLVLAAGGLGAVAGALALGRGRLPRRHLAFMYLAWTLATLSVAGYGLATRAWHAMAACLAFNALEAAGTVVWATTKQRLVPAGLLGRVSSLDWLISIGLLPLSFALTGPAAAAFGLRPTLVGAGVLGAAATLGFLFLPGMRAAELAQQQGA
jgi:MFS family permease